MHLRHEPTGDEPRVLATDVETADGLLSQGVGLMFRRSIPDDFALVFRFDRPATRRLHMVFVPFDIDAAWLVDGEVTHVQRLSAWTGTASARAETVVETPAGALSAVEPGDGVTIVDAERE